MCLGVLNYLHLAESVLALFSMKGVFYFCFLSCSFKLSDIYRSSYALERYFSAVMVQPARYSKAFYEALNALDISSNAAYSLKTVI